MKARQKVYGVPKLKLAGQTTFCSGCHYGTIVRLLCEVIEELGIEGDAIGCVGIGCAIAMPTFIDVDFAKCAHGRAPAVATGLKRIHPDAVVFTVQGDGDLGAIGLGNFLNALVRGEKLTTIFLNNAGYGMTGGQLAPTTLLGMRTTTTPEGRNPAREGYPLHVAELAATMQGTAYSARVSVHTTANYQRAKRALKTAFQKQTDGVGYGLIEFLSACPTDWGLGPVDCLAFISENMVREYPLGEFKNVDSIDYAIDARVSKVGKTAR